MSLCWKGKKKEGKKEKEATACLHFSIACPVNNIALGKLCCIYS